MAEQHGIIGDNQMEDLLDPDYTPPGIEEEGLNEEKKMARFSKTAEFKRLKGYIEGKIRYYQNFMPDGRPVGTDIPTGEEWALANAIVAEFKAILSEYESAVEAVKDANRRQD